MNTEDIVTEVRREWLGPATTSLSTDKANVIAHANRVLEDLLIPRLIDLGEEYLIARERVTVASDHVRIPSRAYNSQIRKIDWRDSASGRARDIDLVSPADKNFYATSGLPFAAYLEGNYLVLLGDSSGFLDFSFPFRPGKLVDSDNYRQVVSVDTGTKTITLDQAVPSSWVSGNKFDVHSAQEGHEPKEWDLVGSTVSGTTITFSDAIDGSTFGRYALAKDDYVVLAGNAAAPMVPQGLHGVIVEGVVTRLCKTQTDPDAWKIFKREFTEAFEEQLRSLDHRVEQRRVLVNQNSRFRRWWRGRRRFA